jgi:hypothetical protein
VASYRSPLHETACTTATDFWNDSCTVAELTDAIEHGAVGATTNPSIVYEVLKRELHLWRDRILALAELPGRRRVRPRFVRDHFLAQMDRFRDVPRGVLAHSTHVRGTGTFRDGVERPRVEVLLATGISRQACERVNLGYMDPAAVRVADYAAREDHGILFVERAGETLYRLAR